MSHISRDDVIARLKQVVDYAENQDVVSLDYISGITVKDQNVGFIITLPNDQTKHKAWLREACEAAVTSLNSVENVTAVLTTDTPPAAAEKTPPRKEPLQNQPRPSANWNHAPIPHVKQVIAVASGKGGVGKSTTTVNLAHALNAMGKRVGILDADIYGPSIPHMMQLADKGQPAISGNQMQPMMSHDIACMSMGLIMQEAAILRGPMVTKALTQMLRNVAWATEENPLDILLIDMPPGTGDIHISLVQNTPLDGAVIITTPQQVATIDAAKSIDMFQKVSVPIMGIIENMSGSDIFGEGGGETLAERYQVPLLGTIPLNGTICQDMESGDISSHAHYTQIASQLIDSIDKSALA